MNPSAERWLRVTEALDQHWSQLQAIKADFETAAQVISAITGRVIALEEQLGDLIAVVMAISDSLGKEFQKPPAKPKAN